MRGHPCRRCSARGAGRRGLRRAHREHRAAVQPDGGGAACVLAALRPASQEVADTRFANHLPRGLASAAMSVEGAFTPMPSARGCGSGGCRRPLPGGPQGRPVCKGLERRGDEQAAFPLGALPALLRRHPGRLPSREDACSGADHVVVPPRLLGQAAPFAGGLRLVQLPQGVQRRCLDRRARLPRRRRGGSCAHHAVEGLRRACRRGDARHGLFARLAHGKHQGDGACDDPRGRIVCPSSLGLPFRAAFRAFRRRR